jgi:hypothetical protein
MLAETASAMSEVRERCGEADISSDDTSRQKRASLLHATVLPDATCSVLAHVERH